MGWLHCVFSTKEKHIIIHLSVHPIPSILFLAGWLGGGGGGEWMDAFPVCLSGMRMIIKEAVGKADMSNVVSDPVNGGGWLSMYKAQYSTYLPS